MLFLDVWDGLNGTKEVHLLCRVLEVHVDEERVHLTVDIFDGNLEAIEASSFCQCDLRGEVVAEVFVDDTIGCCKEGEDVTDKVLFCQ